MKLIKWKFRSLEIPMVKDDSGELYCTSVDLRNALGVSKSSLLMLLSRHRDELHPIPVGAAPVRRRGGSKLGAKRANADAGEKLRVTNCDPKAETGVQPVTAYLREHRLAFGVKRVRADLLLFRIDTAIGVAFFMRSGAARRFRREAIQLIREQAVEDTINREEFVALQERLAQTEHRCTEITTERNDAFARMDALAKRMEELERFVRLTVPAAEAAASAAGMALQAQRMTKQLRKTKVN